MVSAISPPYKRQTPTNNPELLEIWRKMYREFHVEQRIRKSRTLEMIGEQHGVSRQTMIYHLSTAYKKLQKKRPSKKWGYEKQCPEIYKKRTAYNSKYKTARNHIDDLIINAYQRVAPKDVMTLENLSDEIHKISGISFHPDTIHGLVNRIESKKGCRMLVEVHGAKPQLYRLVKNHYSRIKFIASLRDKKG